MSNPTRITPHIQGHTSIPSTGFGSSRLAQANPVSFPTAPIRSTGRITRVDAEAAREAAALRLRRNSRRVLVVG